MGLINRLRFPRLESSAKRINEKAKDLKLGAVFTELPELKKEQIDAKEIRAQPRPRGIFFAEPEQPEQVPEHEFKSRLVDDSKKNQTPRRVRRM